MKGNLLILGAGQYGAVVKEIAIDMACFKRIAFLDDCYDQDVGNPEVIGKLDELENFLKVYDCAIPAVGNPEIRLAFLEHAKQSGFHIPAIISPKAYVSPTAVIEKGAIVEPMAGVHTGAFVGEASYISMGAVVNHNAIVNRGCHIDNNAVVMSGAGVKEMTTTKPCEIICR